MATAVDFTIVLFKRKHVSVSDGFVCGVGGVAWNLELKLISPSAADFPL
jgi:hypothetical protein